MHVFSKPKSMKFLKQIKVDPKLKTIFTSNKNIYVKNNSSKFINIVHEIVYNFNKFSYELDLGL